MTDILRLEHVTKSYDGSVNVLKDVSLHFQEGEFVVIIGPSGAGKSTLIRCINQLIRPTGGKVFFNGCNLTELKGRALRRQQAEIGMVFQNYNLIGRTSVLKNVLFGRLGRMSAFDSLFGRYRQEDIQQAMDLLKKVGLEDQMFKRADTLSGGQQQRVGIARAILQQPRLLLADEPIASLDPNSAEVVMNTLQQLSRDLGISCIVNLHQVDFARKYASRIIGLQTGRIVFDGAPAALSDQITAEIYKGREEQMKLAGTGMQEKAYA
jgi:phosphonate transport system ATP-binding protein